MGKKLVSIYCGYVYHSHILQFSFYIYLELLDMYFWYCMIFYNLVYIGYDKCKSIHCKLKWINLTSMGKFKLQKFWLK